MDRTTLLVIAIVVGQGALVGAVLYIARSFGAYTSVVLKAQEENIAIQRANFDMSDDLARLRAQLLAERAAVAERRQRPIQSEEVAS